MLGQISGEINNEVSSRTIRRELHIANLTGRMVSKDNIILMLVKREGHTFHYIDNCLDRFLCFGHNSLKPQTSIDGRGKSNKKHQKLKRRDPFMSLRQISGELNNEVSSRTIRRELHIANLPGRMARKDNIILMLVERVGHTFHYIDNCLDRFLCFVHNSLKPQKSNDGRGKFNKKHQKLKIMEF